MENFETFLGCFFILAQISKNRCQITLLSIFSLGGDLSQREKLSEIKPPLAVLENFSIGLTQQFSKLNSQN